MDIKLNLAIILEASSEIGLQHFLAAKEFIKKLLELNDVSATGTHVSLVLFNNRAYDIISFQQPSSQNIDVLSIVLQFLPPQLVIAPGKRLDIALTHVNDNVFNAVTSQGQDITDVAVFITDGRIIDGNNITGTVSSLKEKNIKLVTVSSGTDIRQEVLYDIAGPNMCLSVSLQEMVANVEKVATKVCSP
ncbi:Matrilin 2 [Porites harrisoni]